MIDITVTLTVKRYILGEQSRQPIPDILRSWMNPYLWKELTCDGDGWWIQEALMIT